MSVDVTAPHRVDLAAHVAGALRGLAPTYLRVGARTIDAADIDRLHPDEASVVATAAPGRRREFASGRRLLHELIGDDVPVLAARNRAALLPAPWTGSLSHDDEVVVAAVGRDDVVAIGVDVEPHRSLETDVERIVRRHDDVAVDASMLFSAKEAVYKAWSALGGRLLDHHDVRLVAGAPVGGAVDGVVVGSFVAIVGADERRLRVDVASAAGRWISLAVVPRDQHDRWVAG